ncbi:PST family polysaccharide transporter [Actinocorallia herbida]|uniref:PST family polysaccharide transporter n=1 Tax=Actinocorallia herbida TaxID=58109 RepID=A0A3N1CNF7_9ACTN|nr:oligosaccharide flippase family protein [Actinocorallia herbida]ROO82735.1 PST family polysaccharide transporter [Actinocorallia herbida]
MTRAEGEARTAEGEERTAEVGRGAARGLRWSLLGNLVNRAGTFVVGLVLARILLPQDYGEFAIAFAASQFLMHVNDAGIIAAIVQWRGRLADLAPTATVLAFLSSTGIYLLFFAAAPWYAATSGDAGATGVVRILTATILVDGITAVRAARLLREFRQDRLIVANLAGFVVTAALTIGLALAGAGAYSFAWGQLSGAIVTGACVLWFGRMPFSVRLDRSAVRHLVVFGLPLALSLGLEGLILNVDKMVIGSRLGAVVLGFYLIAFNVSSWVPGLIGTAIRWVALPSFSRLAEEGEAAVAAGVRTAVVTVTAFALPVMLVLGLLAPQAVTVLYGERWEPAGQALRFLAAVMLVRLLLPLAFDILTALGATRWTVVLNAGWCLALVPALLVGAGHGLGAAAAAQAVVGLGVTLPLAAWALSRVGVRVAALARPLARPLLAALAAGLVIAGADRLLDAPAVVELGVAGGAGTALYIVLVLPLLRELRK